MKTSFDCLFNNRRFSKETSDSCNGTEEILEMKETLNPHIPGVKLDGNKPDLALVLNDFSRALYEVGKVGTFGAKKYTEHGWLEVDKAVRRYESALLRHHFLKEIEGDYDKETGLLHDAHKAWNALAVLEKRLREIEEKNNDRCEI